MPLLISHTLINTFCHHLKVEVHPLHIMKQRMPTLQPEAHSFIKSDMSKVVRNRGPTYWQADHYKKRCRRKVFHDDFKCIAHRQLRLILPAVTIEQHT